MTNPNSGENLDGSKWSESNWREDYLNTKQRLSQFQIKLLKEGPSSFGGALIIFTQGSAVAPFIYLFHLLVPEEKTLKAVLILLELLQDHLVIV